MTCFRYLLTNTLFFTGQWSSFVMFAISFPLSLFSLPQSHNRCSTVWALLPQGHSGDSIILNWCKYALVFPYAVTIDVKLGVYQKNDSETIMCIRWPRVRPSVYQMTDSESIWYIRWLTVRLTDSEGIVSIRWLTESPLCVSVIKEWDHRVY